MPSMLVAGNWKMHGTLDEALDYAGQLAPKDGVEVAVMPPFTLLHALADPFAARGVALGAQNAYHEQQGAFTGEISPAMLRDAGCRYVILGHSERRYILGEDDETIAKKLAAAWEAGLEPILCIGELLEEREAGRTEEVLARQLSILERFRGGAQPLTVAYEPVWAIGTGRTATPEMAEQAHAFVHGELVRAFGRDARVLYGGSVKPENARALMERPGVDGVLVGGASLSADSFNAIIAAGAEAAAGKTGEAGA